MFYTLIKKQIQIHNRRSFLLLLGKFGFFSIVGWRLFDIQILQSAKYRTLSKENQINIEILYPVRGEIRDRNDVLLAKNIKTYELYIVPEQCPDINKTLNKLNDFVSLSFNHKRKVIKSINNAKKFERILIMDNINWQNLEIIEANKGHVFNRVYCRSHQSLLSRRRTSLARRVTPSRLHQCNRYSGLLQVLATRRVILLPRLCDVHNTRWRSW